jgi:crotonobetainyl-CoA:carnitine CoA-transferase CaiB-like acyl-CoA transferase
MGGLMSITGKPGRYPVGEPMRVGVPIVDLMTGMYTAVAVLGALVSRSKNQKGQYIDLSLLDVQTAMLSNQGMNYLVSKKVPGRIGNTHPNIVPYQVFRTKDGFVIVGVGNDRQFQTFCRILNCKSLMKDNRFSTNEKRVIHREILSQKIQRKIRPYPTKPFLKLFDNSNIPIGPINNIRQVFDNPQTRYRGMVKALNHPYGKSLPFIKNPILYSDTPLQFKTLPPALGQHTKEVLKEYLGISPHEYVKLRNQKVV